MINVSGMKVVPSEVEEVLSRFPALSSAKSTPANADRRANSSKRRSLATTSLDLAALRAHCIEQLVYYKRPESIIRLDALPRSAAGKIFKDQLP